MKSWKKALVASSMLFCGVVGLALAGCGGGSNELKDFPVEGGTYTGTAIDGVPTGEGTIMYDNGNIYEGSVKDGKPEGEGVMIDVITEGTYTGLFSDGKYHDPAATFEYDNGGIYIGGFEQGKMKGQGTFTWPTGDVLEATFNGSAGKEGSAGSLTGEGSISFVGGITFEGTVEEGFPDAGTFEWPNNGPSYTGNFTAFLTGYGTLDMKNGIEYYGPMGGGLLVPVDAWTSLSEKVTIAYPENTDYKGETFEGSYIYNETENKDELKGTITYKDGTTIEDVTVALDFSFSYRYSGTYTDSGITYTGEMRDHNVPYGAGTYAWSNGGPEFAVVSGHGWLTGYGTLTMENGIAYYGPMSSGLLTPTDAWTGLSEKVTITYPENIDYQGEVFEGSYVHNDAENKYELKGAVTYKDGTKIENVTVALDFSHSYRYSGTYTDSGITYTGAMRDHNVPYGAGKYVWSSGPEFTVVNGHGWLTGYGTLDMKNGFEYYGPLNCGLFAPVDMWTALSEKVTVAYPENTDYSGETFEGSYVYNDDLSGYELKGTVTYQGGAKLQNVTLALDFSFSYRYLGTFEGGGITYTGGMRDHNIPYGAGTYAWAGGGPEFTVVNGHGWLTGYGTLDMKNGFEYYGPLSGGLFAPVDMWTGLSEKVTVAYPESADYSGETFEGGYVYNEDTDGYELKGTITYKDGTTIDDVTVALDFSFSYRYLGTFESGGITYTGEMRDHNVPYGAGMYAWAGGGPEFTVVNGHGWLTGYGTLDMKNGITYEGPLNAVQLAIVGGNEFQPYMAFDGTVVDTVKITTPEGIFEGTLEHLGVDQLQNVGVKGFYGNATYLSVGTMKKGDETVPALFIPSFGFGIYELKTTEQGVPVVAGGLPYEGQYIVVGAENIPFGEGQTYWAAADQAPYIESDFFFHNSTGVVKFVQIGYTYEGGMSLQAFGAECGVAEATVTFDDGRTFAGVWEDGILKGTLTMQDGSTKQGTIQITLVTCEFTEVSE